MSRLIYISKPNQICVGQRDVLLSGISIPDLARLSSVIGADWTNLVAAFNDLFPAGSVLPIDNERFINSRLLFCVSFLL